MLINSPVIALLNSYFSYIFSFMAVDPERTEQACLKDWWVGNMKDSCGVRTLFCILICSVS